VANQWYIRRGSNVNGPSTSAQLKRDAAEGMVKRDDEVSQSTTGPWTVAQKVKGLFPAEEASDIFQFYGDETAVQESSSTKPCPFCAEKIQTAAIKCKHCGEFLSNPPSDKKVFDSSQRPQSGSPNLSELDKRRIMEEEAFKMKARETHQNASPLRKGLQMILLLPMLLAVLMLIGGFVSGDAEMAKAAGVGVVVIGIIFGATFINRVA
jgi:GYF domain 2